MVGKRKEETKRSSNAGKKGGASRPVALASDDEEETNTLSAKRIRLSRATAEKITPNSIPRHGRTYVVWNVVKRMFGLWTESSDLLFLANNQSNVFIASNGKFTCVTQDWVVSETGDTMCMSGPEDEDHPHAKLQDEHLADIYLRLIKRIYMCGVGKDWDPDGWPDEELPSNLSRFRAFCKFARRELFAHLTDEEINPLWLDPGRDDVFDTLSAHSRYLKQSSAANGALYPSAHYRAISRMHYPWPREGSRRSGEALTLIKQRWSNVLGYTVVREWIVRKGEEAPLTELIDQERQRVHKIKVRRNNHGKNSIMENKERTTIVPLRCYSVVRVNHHPKFVAGFYPPNFVLTPGHEYLPRDGPLFRRGVFLPIYDFAPDRHQPDYKGYYKNARYCVPPSKPNSTVETLGLAPHHQPPASGTIGDLFSSVHLGLPLANHPAWTKLVTTIDLHRRVQDSEIRDHLNSKIAEASAELADTLCSRIRSHLDESSDTPAATDPSCVLASVMGSELVLKDSLGPSHFVKQPPSSLANNPTRPQTGHSLVPPSRRRSPRLNQLQQLQKQTRLILPTLTPTEKKSVPIRGALLTPPDEPLAEDYIHHVESSSSEVEEKIHAPKTAGIVHLKPLQSEEMEERDDPAPFQSSDSDVESEDEGFQSRSSSSTAISQLGDDQLTSGSNAPGNEEGNEAENHSTRSTSSESPKASELDLSPVASGSDDLEGEGEAESGSSRRKVFVDNNQEPSTADFSRDLPLPSMNRGKSDPILSVVSVVSNFSSSKSEKVDLTNTAVSDVVNSSTSVSGSKGNSRRVAYLPAPPQLRLGARESDSHIGTAATISGASSHKSMPHIRPSASASAATSVELSTNRITASHGIVTPVSRSTREPLLRRQVVEDLQHQQHEEAKRDPQAARPHESSCALQPPSDLFIQLMTEIQSYTPEQKAYVLALLQDLKKRDKTSGQK